MVPLLFEWMVIVVDCHSLIWNSPYVVLVSEEIYKWKFEFCSSSASSLLCGFLNQFQFTLASSQKSRAEQVYPKNKVSVTSWALDNTVHSPGESGVISHVAHLKSGACSFHQHVKTDLFSKDHFCTPLCFCEFICGNVTKVIYRYILSLLLKC